MLFHLCAVGESATARLPPPCMKLLCTLRQMPPGATLLLLVVHGKLTVLRLLCPGWGSFRCA